VSDDILSGIYWPLITAIVGGTIAIVGIAMQRKTSREKNALEFDVFYQTDEEVRSHWTTIANYINDNKNKKNIGKVDRNNDAFNSFIFILNTWERASNAIRHNIFDEDYLYNVLGSTAIRIYDELEDFIKIRQGKSKLSLVNYEWLVIKWRIRKKVDDRNIVNAESVMILSEYYTSMMRRDYLHSFERKEALKAQRFSKEIKNPFKAKKINSLIVSLKNENK